MANFVGTSANNTVFGTLEEDNFFRSFGIGLDRVTGGNRKDVFTIDTLDGSRDVFDGGPAATICSWQAPICPAASASRLRSPDRLATSALRSSVERRSILYRRRCFSPISGTSRM